MIESGYFGSDYITPLESTSVEMLLAPLREHNPQAYQHTINVARYALEIAGNIPPEEARLLWLCSILHDVGKGEEGFVYSMNNGTDDDKRKHYSEHSLVGADIIADGLNPFLFLQTEMQVVEFIARFHHGRTLVKMYNMLRTDYSDEYPQISDIPWTVNHILEPVIIADEIASRTDDHSNKLSLLHSTQQSMSTAYEQMRLEFLNNNSISAKFSTRYYDAFCKLMDKLCLS